MGGRSGKGEEVGRGKVRIEGGREKMWEGGEGG